MDLPIGAWAAIYEEAARSIFGPLAINCMAPDDGNVNLLKLRRHRRTKGKVVPPDRRGEGALGLRDDRARPGLRLGSANDAHARREKERPLHHARTQVVHHRRRRGRAFILIARTTDDPRRGLTAFLYHKDQPGWRILRRIPIMGPEEHGGHCELEFDGLEIPFENVLMTEGDGLRTTQIRLGPAQLTHCMRWLGFRQALRRNCAGIRGRARRLRNQAGRSRKCADQAGGGGAQSPDRPPAHNARRLEARSGLARAQGSLDGKGPGCRRPAQRRRRCDPAQWCPRLFAGFDR